MYLQEYQSQRQTVQQNCKSRMLRKAPFYQNLLSQSNRHPKLKLISIKVRKLFTTKRKKKQILYSFDVSKDKKHETY